MNWSLPDLPVLHSFPEFAQTHVHWVSDAIPPSHPLSHPSPPAFNLSQHQGLFHQVHCIRWPKYWSSAFASFLPMKLAFLVGQRLKHLPARRETQVQSLGREDPLEKEMATHSSILALRIPWTEEPGTVHGVAKSRTRLSDFTFTFTFQWSYFKINR